MEGPTYEIVKVFHTNVISLQFQIGECHKLLTDKVDESILRHNVNRPLPLGGPLGQVTIQSDFFFNKDLEYLRYGRKIGRPALSISKMKAAYYPDVGLEQMVPDQMWIKEECKYDIAAMYGISHWWLQRQRFYIDKHTSEGDRRAVRTHMRILSVVRIEVFSLYRYDYMKKIVLRRADLKEYTIAKRGFKYPVLSDLKICTRPTIPPEPEGSTPGTSTIIPRSRQSRRDLPRDNPLVSVEVLSEDGNPARANIKQALGLHKDGDADASFHFRNSDKYYHDPEEFARLNHEDPKEHNFKLFWMLLALTPCYSAFHITVDVPEVYMHQFWDSVYKHDTFYRFKMDKRKRFKLNLEVFRDNFKICPRVQGQDFDALPTDEEIVSFLKSLGTTREIHSLNDVTTGLDKLYLSRAQSLWGMYHQKNVDYVKLLWEDFIYQIDNKAYKKQENMMHTFKDDYLINTLRFVFAKEETQIYGAILPDSLTSPEMKETKAYKTYLGFASGATPPKKVQKFKKPASPKLTTVPVSTEELTGKSKRVKRPIKKSTKASARGVVITETPEMPLSKKKEKVDITRGKGIELLSQVALTKDAQFEEVQKKSIRDFHKTHLSGSGTVTKTGLSAAKIKPSGNDEDGSNNEQDSSDEDGEQENDSDDNKTQSDDENESDSDHETEENKSGSESNHKENEEDEDDEEEVKDEFVKTPSNNSDDEDEIKIDVKTEGDEDEKIDYTTSHLYDDG
ncbi:hypothetical protein Tco_0753154 [Tanacetum coccineum]